MHARPASGISACQHVHACLPVNCTSDEVGSAAEGRAVAEPVQEDLTTFSGSVGRVRHPGHSQPKPGKSFLMYAGPCR